MYDIFDDIFDDGYGSNGYGMSDTDVDVELAFEAAMSSDYGYYAPAYEGFGDVMGKIGTKIADAARNMVRKIGELFKKIASWVRDKLAPLRAKSTSHDNKPLQQVLKSLDRQVQNATGERKAQVKERVARVKRAIMQTIDAYRSSNAKLNKILSDGVSIFKAAQTIGKSFIEKLNAAVASGSEKGNTDDGNDLVDKMNALERRYATMAMDVKDSMDVDDDERIKTIIGKEMPGSSSRMTEILKLIKWDKIDFRAIFAAEAELRVTCNQGSAAAERLQNKLNDKYSGYKKAGTKFTRDDNMDITDNNKKFDDESRQNLSALVANWNQFAELQKKMSEKLVTISGYFETSFSSGMSEVGMTARGKRINDADLPTTYGRQPTEQELA